MLQSLSSHEKRITVSWQHKHQEQILLKFLEKAVGRDNHVNLVKKYMRVVVDSSLLQADSKRQVDKPKEPLVNQILNLSKHVEGIVKQL